MDSAAPANSNTSPSHSSPVPGCAVSPARAPAPKAHRTTWTKPGKSPSEAHLHRARLFFREANYPWESPEIDLVAAEKLIYACGYHRRDEELADAKRVILGKDPNANP
jgi:hypothetical protein